MSFAELAPVRLQQSLPLPRQTISRTATEAVRLLVCKLVAFAHSEACMAVPSLDWLSVTISGNGHSVVLEPLGQGEADPRTPRRVAVRSVDDARAVALRAGILDDLTTGAAA